MPTPSKPFMHYHCPMCSFRSPSCTDVLEHVPSTHPAPDSSPTHRGVAMNSVLNLKDADKGVLNVNLFQPNPFGPKSKIKFNNVVHCRSFPVAVSIVDQLGGMKESKKDKFCIDKFVPFSDISEFARVAKVSLGCDQPAYKMFKGYLFLVCGIDIPLSVLSAITSLKGEVSGARYDDSQEWSKITHIIIGNKIAPKSIREIKRFVPVDALWVTSDWVRLSVENGSVYYNQPETTRFIFSPNEIERFFMIQQAAARIERRKSHRAKPDIHTHDQIFPIVSSSSSSPRTTPPVIDMGEGQQDQSLFRGTPPEHDDEFTPHLNFLPRRRTSIENRVSQVAAPVVAAVDLRRSKRVSVVPNRFSFTPHHSIKKP
jgi:hypothetical protein